MIALPHVWEAHPTNSNYEVLKGSKDTLVRTKALPQGYLWQCGKRYGFSDTVAAAKDWAETIAEYMDVPAKYRGSLS